MFPCCKRIKIYDMNVLYVSVGNRVTQYDMNVLYVSVGNIGWHGYQYRWLTFQTDTMPIWTCYVSVGDRVTDVKLLTDVFLNETCSV